MAEQLQRNDASSHQGQSGQGQSHMGSQGQSHQGSQGGSRASVADLRSDAAVLSADVKHMARDAAAVVKDGATSTAHDLKERAEGAHEKMCGYVKANPTAAILIALGAGAILGRLLR